MNVSETDITDSFPLNRTTVSDICYHHFTVKHAIF